MGSAHSALALAVGLVGGCATARPPVGALAPSFALPSTTGGEIKLADFANRVVVLAFFPKAFTGG